MDWVGTVWAKLGGGAVLLAGIIWLVRKVLSVYIEAAVKQRMETKSRSAADETAVDKALFEKFLETLPSDGSIAFIDEHNMAGFSFDNSRLEQLERFRYGWDDPEHEFLDLELEEKRRRLLELSKKYLGFVAFETFPVEGRSDRQGVPADWETAQPERFRTVVDTLHELAGQVVAAHADLVRTARAKLKC